MYRQLHHLHYLVFPRQKSCRIDEIAHCAEEHPLDFGARKIFREWKMDFALLLYKKEGQLTREKLHPLINCPYFYHIKQNSIIKKLLPQ